MNDLGTKAATELLDHIGQTELCWQLYQDAASGKAVLKNKDLLYLEFLDAARRLALTIIGVSGGAIDYKKASAIALYKRPQLVDAINRSAKKACK